jgi:hypothetical protein
MSCRRDIYESKDLSEINNKPFPLICKLLCLKKSKFKSGPEEIIQPEILVELVIKIVETRYQSKSKNKTFTALRRSTTRSGLKLSLKAPFFTRIEFIQLSKALVSP